MKITDFFDRKGRLVALVDEKDRQYGIAINGVEVNSPEYWDLRHQRDDWVRHSGWAMRVAYDEIQDNDKVIIFGCGQGIEAQKILEKCNVSKILAMDVSPAAIRKANSLKIEAEFVCADIFTSDFCCYDFAISIQNLEHWRPERHLDAVKKMFNSLVSGGKLLITGVGETWSLDKTNCAILAGYLHPNDFHYVKWSEKDMEELLIKAGFSSVKFFNYKKRDRVIALAIK